MQNYTAYFSNSLKKLVPLYIESSGNAKIFDNNTIVIVQNKNMQEWLKFEIASLTGLCSGINFKFPDQALINVIENFPGIPEMLEKKSIVYLDDLKVIIYRQLELIFSMIENYPDFKIVKKYIDESSEKDDTDTDAKLIKSERLFSLSDSIAGLFYYYGLNCPEMVAVWESGKSFIEKTEFNYALHHEKWQAELWRIIFSKPSPYVHIGQLITDILENKFSAPQFKINIAIFGSSFLSEQAVNFLCYLSENCGVRVDHFILSPSPVYSNSASFSDHSNSSLAAVEKWAAIVKGLADILCKKNVKIKEQYELPRSETNLEKLKSAIFNNRPLLDSLTSSKEHNDSKENCGKDNSMAIISASGKKREIEILKNNIIQLVSEKNIKFHEIGVAAPDINEYVPFIESVFPSGADGAHSNELLDIPYNIMDIDIGKESAYVKTFLDLTELCGSRFSRKDLFKIFSSQCFMEKYGLSRKDIDEWLSVCNDLSIKWGVDHRHRKDILSYEDNSSTWDYGFQRIIAGLIFDDREDGVSLPGGKKILPYTLSGNSEEKKISVMFAVVESLYNDLYHVKKMRMQLSEWSSFFERIMDKYLSGDDKSRSFLKNSFRQINNLKSAALIHAEDFENPVGENLLVDFSVFKALLDEYSKSGGYYKGRYLSTGVCFSSLKPLRAIPFSVIFMLGMDIDVFPGKEKPLSYDLRNVTEKSIDLSKQNSDSFAFLETIISAEKFLGISYNGTDSVTGEAREPSVVVSDVGDIIGKKNVQEIIVTHPLFPYNPDYYMEDSKYGVSYDVKNYEPAQSFFLDKKNISLLPVFGKNIYGAEREVYPANIKDVAMFLKTPLSYFLKSELSIYVNPLELAENDVLENLEIDYLEQLRVVEELGKITGAFDCDSFVDLIYKRKILESRVADIPAVKKEYEMFKVKISDLYTNLQGHGYFDSDLVNIIFGHNSAMTAQIINNDIAAAPVLFAAGSSNLEISGHIKALRMAGEKEKPDFHAIITGKKSIKNIAQHFLYYLMLKLSESNSQGDTKCNSYTIYDNSGEKIFTFSDSMSFCCKTESNKIDVKATTVAIANAYISNLQTPYVVDIECIEFGVKQFKNGKTIDEVISAMKKYYDNNSLADTKYLEGFNAIAPGFDDEVFRSLMENFYFHLAF